MRLLLWEYSQAPWCFRGKRSRFVLSDLGRDNKNQGKGAGGYVEESGRQMIVGQDRKKSVGRLSISVSTDQLVFPACSTPFCIQTEILCRPRRTTATRLRRRPSTVRGGSHLMRADDAIDRAQPVLYEISQLLNTQLDKATLATCVGMIENGVNPEALAVRPVVLTCVLALAGLRMSRKLTVGVII